MLSVEKAKIKITKKEGESMILRYKVSNGVGEVSKGKMWVGSRPELIKHLVDLLDINKEELVRKLQS